MHLVIVPENCIYRGEGNSSLVICLKKEEKVLRLEKQDIGSQPATCAVKQRQKFESQVAMVKNVMKPLLGEHLVNCPSVIFIHKDDVKILNSLFSSQRPKFRAHRIVNGESTFALMLPDYCTLPPDLKVFSSVGPVISVEIKPKQGFLAKDQYLPSDLSSCSLLKCRFCMMQQYKIKRKVISSKSVYCPSDLFSGCPTRMQYALKILLETPRNNLRIFKNQTLIYSEEERNDLEEVLFDFFDDSKLSICDLFCNLIIDVLLKTFPEKVNEGLRLIPKEFLQNCSNAYPNCTENAPCHELPVGCVLYRILCLQMLDNLPRKNLYDLYHEIMETKNMSPDCVGCYSLSEIPRYVGERCKMKGETDLEYASRKVWEFLVAITAQDCSIMLVLKKYTGSSCDSPSQNIICDKDENPYLFSIAVADLDAKCSSKVEKRYEETPFLLQTCLSQSV